MGEEDKEAANDANQREKSKTSTRMTLTSLLGTDKAKKMII